MVVVRIYPGVSRGAYRARSGEGCCVCWDVYSDWDLVR